MYRKNAWEKYPDKKEVFAFNEDYKSFLTNAKTERLAVKEAIKLLEEKGFKHISNFDKLNPGDKVYFNNRGKNIFAYIIGEKPLSEGLRILGAHIDSPRLDVKQNPLYERDGFALLDTHYYGGIKKYQWVTIPLALCGVVCKKDGSVIDVNIGLDPNDPVVGISDLLIHLSADQLQKTASKVIEGEDLDLTVGSIPSGNEDDKDQVKANVLNLLKEKYGFEEEDFLSSELEVVPADPSRDYGLDRSMVAGYGHDDRVCAYTSLRALLDFEGTPEYSGCCALVDKEEVGSIGATGAQSRFFENTVAKLLSLTEGFDDIKFRHALTFSKMLSSDVSAGFDPLYPSVNESKNACYLGQGLCFNKFTGRGGKGGANDAAPEYFAEIRNQLDEANVYWQTSEIGKVDQGGGGTIAYILGNLNMNVIDAGVGVLNMHAPQEIVSKVDVYEAYLGYKAFLKLK